MCRELLHLVDGISHRSASSVTLSLSDVSNVGEKYLYLPGPSLDRAGESASFTSKQFQASLPCHRSSLLPAARRSQRAVSKPYLTAKPQLDGWLACSTLKQRRTYTAARRENNATYIEANAMILNLQHVRPRLSFHATPR